MHDSHYGFERILVERRDDGIVLFTINRPERMNATDAVLHREFARLPRRFDEDDTARVAIITGGASGIGLASAERFVAEGANVVIADINDAAGREIEARHDGALRCVYCDVTVDADNRHSEERSDEAIQQQHQIERCTGLLR